MECKIFASYSFTDAKAICLLALHNGLRSCDISNLKFGDFDWESGLLTITQQKTGNYLQLPIDNETKNALIDYILIERRECESEYIFINAIGPPNKIGSRNFGMKNRAKGTESYDKIPNDGLHIFRRTFASTLLRSGAPLELIAGALGQVGNDSVHCYLSTDEEKMKRCSLDLSLIPYGDDFNV